MPKRGLLRGVLLLSKASSSQFDCIKTGLCSISHVRIVMHQTQLDPWEKVLSLSLSHITQHVTCQIKRFFLAQKSATSDLGSQWTTETRGPLLQLLVQNTATDLSAHASFTSQSYFGCQTFFMFYFPPTECEIRESFFQGSSYIAKVTNVATFKNCEGICQRDPVSKFFGNYC